MFRGFVAVIGFVLVVGVVMVPSAVAKDGDVRVRGTCTGGSVSKLKLSEENGRIEVEFEVDQNRDGVRWRLVLRQNGKRVFRGARVTRSPSGSFSVRRLLRDAAGKDRVVAVARRSGEVCRARAAF